MNVGAKIVEKTAPKPRAWPWLIAACLCGFFVWAAIAMPIRPGSVALLGKFMGCLALLLAFCACVAGLPMVQATFGRTHGKTPKRWQLVGVILVSSVFGIWLMGTLSPPTTQDSLIARSLKPAKPVVERPRGRDSARGASVIGRWIIPLDPSVAQLITIEKTGNGYAVELRWKSGQHFSRPLRRQNHGRRFDAIGDATHYVLLQNGDLDIRDKDGEFLTAKRFTGNAEDPAAISSAMDAVWENASCTRDADCMGEPYRLTVMQMCPVLVEHQARYTFRWTNHWYESRFTDGEIWHSKNGQARGLVDYVGDKIELQNGFGAWQNYIYVCTFDIHKKEIVGMEMHPGRLFD